MNIEVIIPVTAGRKVMPKYQDKDYLYRSYIEDKKSMFIIGQETNSNRATIHKWLHKYNIKTRSCGEGVHLAVGRHCNITDEGREIIDGHLLGDGGLQVKSPYSASFSCTCKHPDYIRHLSEKLLQSNVEGKVYEDQRQYSTGIAYYYNYWSYSYTELLKFYRRWYSKGIKRIPDDLSLTPLTIKYWYIGDGTLKHSRVNGKTYQSIFLATCCFTTQEVENLILLLRKIGIFASRQPSNNSIRLQSKSMKNFLNYIGTCPVSDYQYKWRLI